MLHFHVASLFSDSVDTLANNTSTSYLKVENHNSKNINLTFTDLSSWQLLKYRMLLAVHTLYFLDLFWHFMSHLLISPTLTQYFLWRKSKNLNTLNIRDHREATITPLTRATPLKHNGSQEHQRPFELETYRAFIWGSQDIGRYSWPLTFFYWIAHWVRRRHRPPCTYTYLTCLLNIANVKMQI